MNSKHFQTLSRITYFVFFAVFLIACNSSMNLPTNTPVPTSTHTPTETIQPSATFTLEPTSTNTPIPRLLLLSPFSSDCTEPTLIRANGAYNGIIPNPYDSGMAPGGSGNNYQGHSDFQRPKGCSDNGVYAPASGYFYWMNDQKIELTLDTGLLLELNPENPPEFTDAITKVYKSKPTINLQIAHIKKPVKVEM